MRLIDANDLGIGKAKREAFSTPEYADGWNSAIDIIEKAPTVDAVPVVHGRWIKDGDVVVCSECGAEHAWEEYRATYCEDCGAKMDGGSENW